MKFCILLPAHPAILTVLALAALLQVATAAPTAAWETPPGWTQTRGGEGGKTVVVTTLAPTGPGSLRAALETKGARIVEFSVSGSINLEGRSLKASHPHLTIAGETAPSPGITLVNGGLGISTHDVIVRHLRIRPGAGKRAKKSGWEVDGLATNAAHDVIIDHCSITWSTDENLSASGPRFEGKTPDEWRKNTSHRVTFSHCIIGEGLHDSTHAKGPHSKGSLIHDNTSDIAIIGNLYISNDDRNPLFKGGARGVIVNNLIHNPGKRVMQYALNPGEWGSHEWQRGSMALIGNVAHCGPSTGKQVAFLDASGPCDVHLADNLYFNAKGEAMPAEVKTAAKPLNDVRISGTPPSWPSSLTARPAEKTAEWVLANAGARAWERDKTDRRLIKEARTGSGKIINFESEVSD